MKQISSVLLSLALTLCMLTPAVSAAEITTAGGTNEVPVELTQEATAFSVTVPTVLPVDVSATGVVTVATDNKIVNNSFGPVEVKGIEIVSLNDWVLQEFSTDFKTKKVGIKEYGFQMNGEDVATDGSCSAESFGVIPGNDEISFSYNANVASQNTALDKEQIAQVVFTMGWSSDNAISEPVVIADTFADSSWSGIIQACQTDSVPSTWSVGDTKPMLINGTEYNIQIIGKDHDIYTAGGTAPLTFQLVECYSEEAQMNSTDTNSTGWSGSAMRTSTLPIILSTMPSEVQSAIKFVDKPTIEGKGKNSSAPTTLETTSDKLFLLSETEVFGTTQYSGGVAEGSRYAFYSEGGSTIKKLDKTNWTWWLRSPNSSDNWRFSRVLSGGVLNDNGAASVTDCVAFAFCF